MMNEAHNGLLRSIRTREIGLRILPTAHAAGVRHFALEALNPELAAQANETRTLPSWPGYLAQPEFRELIGAALGLGWTLVAYEADWDTRPAGHTKNEETNWREDEQARNLAAALAAMPRTAKLLVWCGNGHHSKLAMGGWTPMGVRFREHAGIDHFALDQVTSVVFHRNLRPYGAAWADAYPHELAVRGGAAGFLAEEAPADWLRPAAEDAYLLTAANELG